eukprot:TRINITY_DN1752_c0_g1_i2.p3 TRINITY_DN1752_c0_g1~~TRINITY_DN1752_c0_g1_i2.p3  ORF type:complete len:161 (-),score=25.76 TRINITY_DN1752_c0_g1_i2:1122-1604(-)
MASVLLSGLRWAQRSVTPKSQGRSFATAESTPGMFSPEVKKYAFGILAVAAVTELVAEAFYVRKVIYPIYDELVKGVNENEGAQRLVGTDVSLKLTSVRFEKFGIRQKDVRGHVDVVGSSGRPMRLDFKVDQSAKPGTWAPSSLVLSDPAGADSSPTRVL